MSGAEGIRQVAQFHADVESLSAAIVTRLTALERSTEVANNETSRQLKQLRFTARLSAFLAVSAIIIAAVAILITARRGA